mgnify:CR=1 FL=1
MFAEKKKARFERESQEPIKVQDIKKLKKDRGEILRVQRILDRHGLKANVDLSIVINQINEAKLAKLEDYMSDLGIKGTLNNIEILAKLAR